MLVGEVEEYIVATRRPGPRAQRPLSSGFCSTGTPNRPRQPLWECLTGVMATAEPGSRSGRAVGWPLEDEEEGGGGGEGRGLVELEEARATTRRRRAAQALGPSQAASLPAAGGWMGRLQAAAAAAEAAAAAVAVSAASTNHLPYPSIGKQSSGGARSPLSPLPLPPRQSAARKTLDFRGGVVPHVGGAGWRLGGTAAPCARAAAAPPLPGLSALAAAAAAATPIFAASAARRDYAAE